MIRISLSFLSAFVLFYIQSVIVMELFRYENGIRFDNYVHVAVVCLVNFFLALAVLTELTPWFLRVTKFQLDTDTEES